MTADIRENEPYSFWIVSLWISYDFPKIIQQFIQTTRYSSIGDSMFRMLGIMWKSIYFIDYIFVKIDAKLFLQILGFYITIH